MQALWERRRRWPRPRGVPPPERLRRKKAFNELSRAYFASLHDDVCEQHQAYVNWKNKTNLRYDG